MNKNTQVGINANVLSTSSSKTSLVTPQIQSRSRFNQEAAVSDSGASEGSRRGSRLTTRVNSRSSSVQLARAHLRSSTALENNPETTIRFIKLQMAFGILPSPSFGDLDAYADNQRLASTKLGYTIQGTNTRVSSNGDSLRDNENLSEASGLSFSSSGPSIMEVEVISDEERRKGFSAGQINSDSPVLKAIKNHTGFESTCLSLLGFE